MGIKIRAPRAIARDALGAANARLRDWALRLELALASVNRRRLGHVTFIGVTGSAGKTTSKELITGMLGTELRGRSPIMSRNSLRDISSLVLSVRRRDSFCVAEIPAWERGSVARGARTVRPQIAVVTTIGLDHRSAFKTLEAVAEEKRGLLNEVSPDGVAVLNADDPHVMAMSEGFPGRVFTFGRSPAAMLRAEDVSASWPERLSFTLCHEGTRTPVITQLCGEHLLPCALAALSVSVVMGMELKHAAQALARVEPVPGRMSPVVHAGITFIRDDWKAPQWTFDTGVAFLASARARRKIAVIGTISEGTGRDPSRYASAARRLLGAADLVLFVGPKAKYAEAAARDAPGQALRLCADVREAARVLAAELCDGDLVLIKGSNRADHLLRLVLAHTADVQCWRTSCRKGIFCDQCPLLYQPEREAAFTRSTA